jgi:hypothetical protein
MCTCPRGLKDVIKQELVRKMYLRVKPSILKSGRQLIKYVSDVTGFKVPLGGFRGGFFRVELIDYRAVCKTKGVISYETET